ncbi:MAG: hypothetical protein K5851_05615 [Lachnospiraceae bacterium]|nr:hypothetical protein [Lachnospiraceae bacterium]
MNITITEDRNIYKGLPLIYKSLYKIYTVSSNGVVWLALEPKDKLGLSQLRKNRAYLEKMKQVNCVLFLEEATFYSVDKMKEEGIPYVLKEKEIFLPFLGMLLSNNGQRIIKPVHIISFLTQKILLTGLYEEFDKATVTLIAQKMDVSKMAVSKCFDEIEYLGIDVMDLKGKSRAISMNMGKKACWEIIKPFLRSPIIKRFVLEEDANLQIKAGISALSEYSMLTDNSYPTYAVTKQDLSSSGIKELKEAVKGDTIGSIVLEVGYHIDTIKPHVQDPLSVLLSIEDEMDDERVEGCSLEMLEEYVW